MSELLAIKALDLWPGDCITEGTRVTSVEVDRNPWGTDDVKPIRVEICKARWEPLSAGDDGPHLHMPSFEPAEVRGYNFNDQIRVIRPAPMEPCGCGFTLTAGAHP